MADDGAGLRDEAEKYLRALAGDHARLREDQWTAISALVAEGRRALGPMRFRRRLSVGPSRATTAALAAVAAATLIAACSNRGTHRGREHG